MKKIETKALVEASLLVALAAIIMIMSAYVPFFALVGVIIWPIPITLLTFKYDLKISLLSLAVLLIIVASLVDPISAVSLGLMYGMPAVVLGFCLKRNYSSFMTIVSMSLSMFVAYIAMIRFGALLTGVDVLEEFFNMLAESMEMSKELMKSFGLSQEQINQSMAQAINPEVIRMMLPGMLAVTSLTGSFINYYFVGVIFKKLKITIKTISPLDQWFINNNLSFGLFFITITAWLMVNFKVENAEIVFNSVFIIFSYAFLINGFAVAFWFLKVRGISKKVRVFILVMLYMMGFSQILFYLGLIDYAFDFRKINPARRRKIPPGE